MQCQGYQGLKWSKNGANKKKEDHFPNITPAPLNKTIVSPDFTFPAPRASENSKNSPLSTWNNRNRASSPARLFTFSTPNRFAASSNTLPTFHRESNQKSPLGGSTPCVSDVPTTCRYTRLSAGTLESPLAAFLRALTWTARAAGLLGFGFGLTAAAAVAAAWLLSFPHERTRANIDRIVSFGAPAAPLPSRGGILAQSCSSLRRCLRQYSLEQSGQRTPGSLNVLIKVLHDTCAH